MVRFAEERYGRLDIAFNNAGVFHAQDDSVTNTSEEIWDFVIDVNLKGVFLGCKYEIPALLRAGGGSIINTASFVAIVGAAAPQIAYTASKGGVLAMTREIAVEFARRNIRVNALCPGPVETPLLAELLSDPARPAAAARAHSAGALCARRGDGQCGAVPRQRRVVLRERVDVSRGRRNHGGVHHGGVTSGDCDDQLVSE